MLTAGQAATRAGESLQLGQQEAPRGPGGLGARSSELGTTLILQMLCTWALRVLRVAKGGLSPPRRTES